MLENFHTVTATLPADIDGPTRVCDVDFACTAPAGAPCRTYPSCECEGWCPDPEEPGYDTGGHQYVPQEECWIQGWFDGDAAHYVGDDATVTGDGVFGDGDRPTTPRTGLGRHENGWSRCLSPRT